MRQPRHRRYQGGPSSFPENGAVPVPSLSSRPALVTDLLGSAKFCRRKRDRPAWCHHLWPTLETWSRWVNRQFRFQVFEDTPHCFPQWLHCCWVCTPTPGARGPSSPPLPALVCQFDGSHSDRWEVSKFDVLRNHSGKRGHKTLKVRQSSLLEQHLGNGEEEQELTGPPGSACSWDTVPCAPSRRAHGP